MIKPTLKTKITLFLPLSTCLVMAVLLVVLHTFFETTVKESISTQQNFTLSVLADEIDQKLVSTHRLLTQRAAKITPELISNPTKALVFLQGQSELNQLFDNGLFLFDKNGRMITEFPLGMKRSGTDYSHRDYLASTFATKKPFISDPYTSSQEHHHPAITMTAPIVDAQGNVLAVLGGSLDLLQDNFLGRLTKFKIGNTGYLFLFSSNRVMIAHPDPARIMQQDIPEGANQLLDKAVKGFDGTGKTVNSRGLTSLTSFRHLKTNNWILGANYPTKEAFAPIARLNIFFAIISIPTLALLLFALRHLLGKITEPLLDFTRHVELLPTKTGIERLYHHQAAGEIATLRNAFNNLISDLDRKREEMTQRELLYRTVTTFSSDLVYWASPQRDIIHYISPDCERICGYKDKEFYIDPDLLSRIIHPDHRNLWKSQLEQSQTVGTTTDSESIELLINTRDGCSVWVSHECRPVWGENGTFLGFRGSFRDITAQRNADLQLHRQNEYLRALHETTLGLIGRLDLHSLLAAIITRAASLMETEHGFFYLLNDDKTAMEMQVKLGVYENLVHKALKRGEGLAGYVWQQGKACTIPDYSAWEWRIQDLQRDMIKASIGMPLISNGSVVGVLGLSYTDNVNFFDDDKLELLQQFAELASLALGNANLYDAAQKELIQRTKVEEKLRIFSYAVEQSPVSIIITDLNGDIEFANPHFTRLTGYEQHELMGQNPRVLKSGFTSNSEYKRLWDTILAGEEWSGEFQNRKKNGELYWERALIAPIRNIDNVITHFIAIKEDVSDRKKLENQLQHSQKMEAVGQLAGGIAHDFNNILTAIIGYASILQMKLPPGSDFIATADQILSAAERGASLTQGLLAFSRKQTSSPGQINLNEIVERIEKLLQRLIAEDIHLKTMLTQQPLVVLADSIQIEQVLMNLATNARDAMPGGGTIVVSTEKIILDQAFISANGFGEAGAYAMLTFSDTGEGIDPETAKRIFEPFYTTKETGKGTGLGLSIVYGIVKKHNGFITCHSSPNKGAAFRIYLPLSDCTAEEKARHTPDSPYSGGSEMILLAEDDEIMLQLSRELLVEFGYSVIEANDGFKAVELYKQEKDRISMVMLDAIMPGLRGMEVYEEIRKINPSVRVLFCSGYTEDIIQNQGILDQNVHFIAKPFTPKELLMKIREVVIDAT